MSQKYEEINPKNEWAAQRITYSGFPTNEDFDKTPRNRIMITDDSGREVMILDHITGPQICRLVTAAHNNTYAASINPEAIGGLVEAAQRCYTEIEEAGYHTANENFEALGTALAEAKKVEGK